MAYENRDYTHLSESEKQRLELIAQAIRNKAYGIDVRESIALAIEWVNREYKSTIENNILTVKEFENAKRKVNTLEADMSAFLKRYSEQVAANTDLDEVIDARLSGESRYFTSLKQRLDKENEKTYGKDTINKVPPMVTFYLDDAYEADYDIVMPKASSLGIPITICIYKTSQLVYKPDKLSELVNEHGWELHAHATDGESLKGKTEEQLHYEFSESNRFFSEMGYDLEGITYPIGETDENVLKVAREYYKVGMGSDVGINNPPIDTYHVHRYLTDSGMAQIKAQVDKIVADGTGWLVLYAHAGQFPAYPNRQANFFEMMDYVKSKGIETVTVKDALKHYENTLDIGDRKYSKNYFKVGSDGIIDSPSLPIVKNKNNASINDRKGTDFASGRMSINTFPIGSPSNIPFDNGLGTLYTDRTFEDERYTGTLAVQTFVSVNGTIVNRNYNTARGWSDWLPLGSLNTLRAKPYTDATPITDYPNGKVTKVGLLSGQAPNLPHGGIGTLETNRLGGNDVLGYQLLHPYNNSRIYKRQWTGSAWTDFQMFVPIVTHNTTHDFGTLSAGQNRTVTLNVSNVTLSNHVSVNFPYGIADSVIPFAYITNTDTVVIKLINVSSSSVTVGTRDIKLVITKS